MKRFLLEAVVFICGGCVMVYELVGSRVLAPYVGTSTFVWTSLIGVILGSLSIGYWIGGRIADRKAETETLGAIVFLAAAIIGITNYLKDTLLQIIQMTDWDLRVSSVLASILLFAPGSVLLGMVSPYAVKLKSKALDDIGSTVGDLYALSTIGSILGTFLAGFYLIPRFGTNNILSILSFTLTGVAILTVPLRQLIKKVVMAMYCVAIFAGGRLLDQRYNGPFPLADVDTEYSRVRIEDDLYLNSRKENVPVRIMLLNTTLNAGIYQESDELLFLYTRYFRLAREFRPEIGKALMIGGGAFVYPRDFLRMYPGATMDVVEIDPRLTALSKQYFRLRDDPRLRIINEDGRTFLNRSRERYDVIFCDAYASVYSIPHQLTTLEAVKHLHRILNDGGTAIFNIASAVEGDQGRFLRAEYATVRSVFPYVYLFLVQDAKDGTRFQNIMMVAVKGNQPPLLSPRSQELREYLSHLWRREVPLDMPILTDDYAPVEHYVGLHS